MKKILAVFAHPDDEAFGPGGTLALYSQKTEIYLICATRGDQGTDNEIGKKAHAELSSKREEELKKSAQILGIKELIFLDFKDGTLNNNLYSSLYDAVDTYVKKIKPHVLLTYEPRGISGHIDHIVMSNVTSHMFQKNTFVKKLYYYCLNKKYTKPIKNYFVFFPEGYHPTQISTTISTRSVWKTKVKSMMAHKSQVEDARRILKHAEKVPKKEYFILANSRIRQLQLPETDLLNGLK